ncbi:MAG: hypothetical protein IJS02_00945 [Bacteroidales bacterium]|nr:hypothetical protein [Bacteroidales bacterium]
MKRILNVLAAFSLFALVSCAKDEVIAAPEHAAPAGEICVVDGHLEFQSDDAFESYFTSLITQNLSSTKSVISGNLNGFKSIRQRKEELSLTKGGDSEEMTEEEYELMIAENLLLDPALAEVMDCDLSIAINGRLYKITPYGTFSVDLSDSDLMDDIIDGFDGSLVKTLQNGQTVSLGGSATFTNTFGAGSSTESILEMVPTKALPQVGSFTNTLHLGYGTVDYKWENQSLLLKFCDLIRGKNVSKECSFDATHRVKVSLYDVNYLFYASTGIKCEMQTQKKLLFVKYWVSDVAENIAVGFNKLYGELLMKNPRNYLNLSAGSSKYWSRFSSSIEGIGSDFVYGDTGLDIIKEWASDMCVFMPCYEFRGQVCSNTAIGNDLYDATPANVFTWLKSQSGKQPANLMTGTRRRLADKDPKVAYFVWGLNNTSYIREKPYLMGVKEYGRGSSAAVRIDTSFGFTVNFNMVNGVSSLGGFLPTEFNIAEVDAFGAAKYNGKWKGVRFITK